jgi:hypothetical protein
MPRSSKRKRASRVPRTGITDEVDAVSAPSDDGEPELDAEEYQRQEENGDANHRHEVEAEIWDSFREEFHEGAFTHPVSLVDERHATDGVETAVEQLPLYLHRSYSLLRELDEQVTGKSAPWLVLNSDRAVIDALVPIFCRELQPDIPNFAEIHPPPSRVGRPSPTRPEREWHNEGVEFSTRVRDQASQRRGRGHQLTSRISRNPHW